jgi:hypothetical protein
MCISPPDELFRRYAALVKCKKRLAVPLSIDHELNRGPAFFVVGWSEGGQLFGMLIYPVIYRLPRFLRQLSPKSLNHFIYIASIVDPISFEGHGTSVARADEVDLSPARDLLGQRPKWLQRDKTLSRSQVIALLRDGHVCVMKRYDAGPYCSVLFSVGTD